MPFLRTYLCAVSFVGIILSLGQAAVSAAEETKTYPEDRFAIWSLQPIDRQAPPTLGQADRDWARNTIDHFIAAKLREKQLTHSAEADRRTLIRRVYYDLLGLPPTPDDVREFVGDPDPLAYEQLVERLLASPHHGERMAQDWLDAARYADTTGYAADKPRVNWLYRDWVVKAFNDNMRFDTFTIEQLAGDMLPNATAAQKVATGFHRNSMQALATIRAKKNSGSKESSTESTPPGGCSSD